MTERIVLRGRIVVARADVAPLRDAAVEVHDGRVVQVRPAAPGDEGPLHDVLLPGLVDAHSHARAMPISAHGLDDGGPLERFLVELGGMTPLAPGDEALVSASDGLATGITTTQVIHHSFAETADYAASACAITDGYDAAGARAAIALALTDQDEYVPVPTRSLPGPRRGVTPADFGQLVDVLSRRDAGAERVRVDAVGPVAPQWCSDAGLAAIAAASHGRRVHTHLLETARQRLASGGDPLARLDRAGLLSVATSVAHGVWLDDAQLARVAETGAVVVHCPGSNDRLAVGACGVRRLLDAGAVVALGLDSHPASEPPDVFTELRHALKLAEGLGEPLLPAEALGLATLGGARALGRDDLGVLEAGAQGDVVALDLPCVVGAADPVATLLSHARREHVAAVWVAGRPAAPTASTEAARARLQAALDGDAATRDARRKAAGERWRAVDAAWRAHERRAKVPS